MRAVNLIPAEQRSSGVSLSSLAGRSGGAAYLVVGVVCGLALIALLYGLAAHEVNSKQGEAERLSAEAAQAQAQAAKLAPYTRFVAMREERLKAVQQLANTRFDWAHSMHELGRVLPSDVALSTVTATVGSAGESSSGSSASGSSTASASASGASGSGAAGAGASVSSATPAGSTPTFTIAGCTTSQSEVALTMDRLRLIDGVSEVSLQSSTKGSSSGGSSSGSSGGCPPGDPTFTLQVTFAALPQPAVKTPPIGASPAADTSSASSGSGRSGTEGRGR